MTQQTEVLADPYHGEQPPVEQPALAETLGVVGHAMFAWLRPGPLEEIQPLAVAVQDVDLALDQVSGSSTVSAGVRGPETAEPADPALGATGSEAASAAGWGDGAWAAAPDSIGGGVAESQVADPSFADPVDAVGYSAKSTMELLQEISFLDE